MRDVFMGHLKNRVLSIIIVLGLCVLLPEQWQAEAVETIHINGSGNALDMMKPLIEAYRKAHPGIRIEMEKPLGSSGALKALLAGALDVAVSSKALKPEELAQGAVLHEYGKTPLLIVTEKSVRKTNITTRELEDIYIGKARVWPDGEHIRVILRPEGDIDTKILRGLSPGMNSAISKAQKQHGMITAVTDPEARETVSKTPGAISAQALTGIVVDKSPLNVLTLNGIKGTPKALADGTYPLAKDISFVTTSRISPAALKLLDFIYSSQGRAIAGKSGVQVTAGNKGFK